MQIERKFNRSLIFGGTGMLAEASAYVACNSRTTLIASRHPERLAQNLHASSIEIDWARQEQTRTGLSDYAPFELIISWLHDDGIWLAGELETMLTKNGRSIRILSSGSDEFTAPKNQKYTEQFVSLGWMNTASGKRWLTHDEICGAVITAIKSPEQRHTIAGRIS